MGSVVYLVLCMVYWRGFNDVQYSVDVHKLITRGIEVCLSSDIDHICNCVWCNYLNMIKSCFSIYQMFIRLKNLSL
jgi:hypothetical protein